MSSHPWSLRTRILLATFVAACGLITVAGPAPANIPAPEGDASSKLSKQVERVRHHTAPYRHVAKAKAAGYSLLKDASGIACIDDPAGGMGVHLVKGKLVADGKVRANRPEALVYEPTRAGKRLVAVEYVVFRKDWRAAHPTGRPHLFGRTFELQRADNRYGLPPFFELHLWAWKHNPAGLFDDWNPEVFCR
ncbi:hypothetical protein [Nocardioides conyzicola]|uniref:Uncharacterized protein n=1 Tax=Nocardioides conyzicola TaxID=1651781 RepID=A0ABP8Y2E4_9ACTN